MGDLARIEVREVSFQMIIHCPGMIYLLILVMFLCFKLPVGWVWHTRDLGFAVVRRAVDSWISWQKVVDFRATCCFGADTTLRRVAVDALLTWLTFALTCSYGRSLQWQHSSSSTAVQLLRNNKSYTCGHMLVVESNLREGYQTWLREQACCFWNNDGIFPKCVHSVNV